MSSINTSVLTYFSENNVRYVFLDGNTCDILEDCYFTLSQQLSFPSYFGKNLDALEEMLSDLDWIEEEKIKIIILNPSKLISSNPVKRNDFFDILNSCKNGKIEIIYLGE